MPASCKHIHYPALRSWPVGSGVEGLLLGFIVHDAFIFFHSVNQCFHYADSNADSKRSMNFVI